MPAWFNALFLNLFFWLPPLALLLLVLVPKRYTDAYIDMLFAAGRWFVLPAWALRQFEALDDFKSHWINPGSYLGLWIMFAYPALALLWFYQLLVALGMVAAEFELHDPGMLIAFGRFWFEGTWVLFIFFGLVLDTPQWFRPAGKPPVARVLGFIRRGLKAGKDRQAIKDELNIRLLSIWLQSVLAHWLVLQCYVLLVGSTIVISSIPPLVLVPLRG